jgi:hypothetical protein
MAEEVTVEQTTPEQAAPVETTETVSQETMAEINQEVEKVETAKIEEAKAEGATSAVDSLKQELADLKAANEAVLKKQQEEAEAARLRAEIEAEKAKAQAPVKKHIVAQATNPNAPPVQAPVQEAPKLSREQEWAEFERNFTRVSVTNTDNQQ